METPDTGLHEAQEAAKVASIEAGLVAAGEPTEEYQPVDYFAFEDVERVFLPDKVQWFEIKALNEGDRKEYLNKTNNEVKVQRASGDAAIKTRPGDDKHLLLKMAIVGFNVVRNGQALSYSPQNLATVLDKFPPKIIDIVEVAVRKKNPWLMAEMTLEDMVTERDRLDEMIEVKKREESGKES